MAQLCERASTIDASSDSSDQSDNEPTTMDFDAEENTSEEPAGAAVLEEQGQVFELEAMDVVPPDDEPVDDHSSWKIGVKEDNVNPLRQIIVKAVLDAMNIMGDSGTSVKTFYIMVKRCCLRLLERTLMLTYYLLCGQKTGMQPSCFF